VLSTTSFRGAGWTNTTLPVPDRGTLPSITDAVSCMQSSTAALFARSIATLRPFSKHSWAIG
jgi:hypothetical protein